MIASHSQLRDSESQGPKNRQTNCNFFRQENGVCRNERHIAGGSLRGAGNDAGRNGYPLLLVSLYLTQTQNLRRPIEESREQQRRLARSSDHYCGNESKFFHCFRFTSFRFERIFGKAVHGLIASITADTT